MAAGFGPGPDIPGIGTGPIEAALVSAAPVLF